MEIPSPAEMIARLRSWPAALPLLEQLGSVPGVHLVGGGVRDLLRGGVLPADLDLVVESDAAALARRIDPAAIVHDRFGTATARHGAFTYDLARARTETYARPGALPDVAPASLREDLARRDFTVNAIALALGGAEAGRLTSAPGALEDLDAARLRILHDASFSDDPTRLFRLIRYSTRLGFEVEERTAMLAGEAVRGGAVSTVSGSRVGNELRLLAREADPVAAVAGLERFGLAGAIHPRFGRVDVPTTRRALALLPDDGRPDLLVIAAAVSGFDAEELAGLLDALAYEARDRHVIVAAATRATQVADALAAAERPSQIAAVLRGAPGELAALAGAQGPEAQARAWLERLRHVRLQIDGSDLVAAGVPEGPQVGRALDAALDATLDGRVSGRDAQLACALRTAGSNG